MPDASPNRRPGDVASRDRGLVRRADAKQCVADRQCTLDEARETDAAVSEQSDRTKRHSYEFLHRPTPQKHADGPKTRPLSTFTSNAASEIARIVSPDGTVNRTHDSTGLHTFADHATQPDETYTYGANGRSGIRPAGEREGGYHPRSGG